MAEDDVRVPNFEDLPLVSAISPARNDGTLDVERCATLHNFLVRYGWTGAGHYLADISRANFFDKHENDAEEIRERLHPDLVLFLESIMMSEETFFVFVEGINDPSDMLKGADLMPDEVEGDEDQFIVLYSTNIGLGEHGVGLIYDQRHHKATMTLGVEDINQVVTPVEEHQDMWFPLETVLTKWIELIRVGKVSTKKEPRDQEGAPKQANIHFNDDPDSDTESDSFDPNAYTEYKPWIWHSYGSPQVDSTVASFHRLVEAIESRKPSEPSGSPLTTPRGPLLSEEALNAAQVPKDTFARSFLTLARRPLFTRIAPGIVIPLDATAFASTQAFTPLIQRVEENLDDSDGTVVPPVLLFPAVAPDGRTTLTTDREQLTDDDEALTGWSHFLRHEDAPSRVPAGLYSEGVKRRDIDSAEEGFRLILPVVLGGEEISTRARKSDGPEVVRSSAGLFQHGFKPFGGEWWRAQRLERLFERWAELVEGGVWRVGPDGVEGSVEMFRDAETVAGSRQYWLSPDW